jgi:Tfp pilus assembly protein PilX
MEEIFSMTAPPSLRNEDGYLAIIGALVLLALLTVISLSASRVANSEIIMAKNEAVYRRNFYLAEGAALEAADHLAQFENLNESSPAWVEMTIGQLTVASSKDYWDNSAAKDDRVIPEPSAVDESHTLFVVGHDGTARGYSLSMDTPTVHSLAIYGRCAWNGISVIKMGYLAAY